MTPDETFSAKLIPPIAGFFGAVIMLSYMAEIPPRHWATALLAGVLAAYFVPPIAVAWLAHQGVAWLPEDGSVEGLLGLLLGLASIHLVGGLTVLGRRFAGDPTSFISRKGDEQ